MKIIKFLLILSALLFVVSCIPGSDDDFSDIKSVEFPLGTGYKFKYDITYGSYRFRDSSEVFAENAYNIDGVTVKWLYQYKIISMTPEELGSDTVRVRLLAYDSAELKYYGDEKRDRSQSHFIYGTPLIFTSPVTLINSQALEEEFYLDSLNIKSGDTLITLNDTLIACVRKTEISDSYVLDVYYTDFGIIKYEGYLNGSWFSARLTDSILK